MKFSTAFVLLSGAPAAMGFQSVGKNQGFDRLCSIVVIISAWGGVTVHSLLLAVRRVHKLTMDATNLD
eukprot:scaffold219_cov119-Skeletonema_dohrnii-CCMP3373.AAC.14